MFQWSWGASGHTPQASSESDGNSNNCRTKLAWCQSDFHKSSTSRFLHQMKVGHLVSPSLWASHQANLLQAERVLQPSSSCLPFRPPFSLLSASASFSCLPSVLLSAFFLPSFRPPSPPFLSGQPSFCLPSGLLLRVFQARLLSASLQSSSVSFRSDFFQPPLRPPPPVSP